VSKLNKSSGGKERLAANLDDSTAAAAPRDDPLAINSTEQAANTTTEEVTIERDPETGAILRVLDSKAANPLNDPLNELDDEDLEGIDYNAFASSLGRIGKGSKTQHIETDVTRQLEEYAASGVQSAPRSQSQREEEWIARLVEKHGDDYKAMFWDKQLNVMQQSEGDLKRRVKKWQAKQK
jgi:nucleolar protein 16